MGKFRKRPVVIEAMQFTDATKDRCFNWVTGNRMARFDGNEDPVMLIETLEGNMVVSLGDWIIKGVKGEFYPCKPDIFAETYEPVEEEE